MALLIVKRILKLNMTDDNVESAHTILDIIEVKARTEGNEHNMWRRVLNLFIRGGIPIRIK